VPARPAALSCPADPASRLQVPEQPEHVVAVPACLLGKSGRGESAVA
jgi:hypothetical protein